MSGVAAARVADKFYFAKFAKRARMAGRRRSFSPKSFGFYQPNEKRLLLYTLAAESRRQRGPELVQKWPSAILHL